MKQPDIFVICECFYVAIGNNSTLNKVLLADEVFMSADVITQLKCFITAGRFRQVKTFKITINLQQAAQDGTILKSKNEP